MEDPRANHTILKNNLGMENTTNLSVYVSQEINIQILQSHLQTQYLSRAR